MELLGAHALLRRLAARYADAEASAVAERADRIAAPSREPLWDFVWRAAAPAAGALERLPLLHHFQDADTLFARSSWSDDASALAFRCGPPEGHHAARLQPGLPDWRLSTGHAHPDAGSFILFANGRYVTGDAGYTGVKQTEHHNTLLVDGLGQEHDGRHEVFRDVPYARLDRIRISSMKHGHSALDATCDLLAAYPEQLGLTRLERRLSAKGFRSVRLEDTLEAKAPRALRALVHADREPRRLGPRRFAIDGARVEIEEPADASASIRPQFVIAQGRPGSVEKGEREQRGWVLALSAPPARAARLVVTLELEGEVR
jgi:hypothetical protein